MNSQRLQHGCRFRQSSSKPDQEEQGTYSHVLVAFCKAREPSVSATDARLEKCDFTFKLFSAWPSSCSSFNADCSIGH